MDLPLTALPRDRSSSCHEVIESLISSSVKAVSSPLGSQSSSSGKSANVTGAPRVDFTFFSIGGRETARGREVESSRVGILPKKEKRKKKSERAKKCEEIQFSDFGQVVASRKKGREDFPKRELWEC